jgi:hypothetical protein
MQFVGGGVPVLRERSGGGGSLTRNRGKSSSQRFQVGRYTEVSGGLDMCNPGWLTYHLPDGQAGDMYALANSQEEGGE